MSIGRIRWRCRRGMKELDVLFTAFVDRCYDALSDPEREAFERLLDTADPELYDLFTRRCRHGDPALQALIERIAPAEASAR
ncbi:MAG: succinate dehydrogenase assembly factor 2 [Gammaproteobacteria bacterium]